MSIAVKPDPAHPAGGHALVTPAAGLAEETVSVTVFDQYSEQYLGEAGWQSTPISFGPYPVEAGVVRIGPEIVNQMEEYKSVRLSLGGASGEVIWPDDVVPSPDMAVPGGMTVPFAPAEAKTQTPLRAKVAPKEPAGSGGGQGGAQDGGSGTGETTGGGQQEGTSQGSTSEHNTTETAGAPAPGGSKLWLWVGLGLLVLVAAGLALWFLVLNREPQPDPEPEPVPVPTPVVTPPADPCAAEARAGLAGQPFGEILGAIQRCGAEFGQDEAFLLVDGAAQGGDGPALFAMGELYDSARQNAALEGSLGLSLPDDPAKAADYYAAARDAGVSDAALALQTICGRLQGASNTLWQTAAANHCQ